MIPVDQLKIGCLYQAYIDYRRNGRESYRMAVYKGDGEYWAMSDWGENYECKPVVIREVRPVSELGIVRWDTEGQLAEWLKDYYAGPRIERSNLVRFEIDSRWRSSTVIDLCRAMRELDSYERLPILADALLDAGCDSDELIKACQREKNAVYAQRIVALVLGGELAEAVRWLERFGERWNFSYRDMIAKPQDPGCSGLTADGVELHGSSELDDGDEASYWRSVELIVGRELRKQEEYNTFGDNPWYWGCSC